MTFRVCRASERRWADSATVPGLREAALVDSDSGANHLEVRLCQLHAGSAVVPHRHPFEESWFILSGSGRRSVADLRYDVTTGDYGFSPVSVGHALEAGNEDLSWLSVRAPKPPAFRGAARTLPAADVTGEDLGRPSETDPRHRYAGHFEASDLGPHTQLSMPGYHGPKITNISVHMLVDRLLGAQHHTLFVAEIAPRSGHGHAATEHYHPFEEIYFFLSGGMLGTLDGQEVQVEAGDLAWVGVDATHGFVNERDEPARWLEVQSPVPPDSEAFFFPDDWRALAR
ncbi:MAG TPA: cupin domain-containing protein [Streptosporangiaceae bacterium]|nr:cupin domain-containing protein [Streptosporangiaceae bacterium]